MPINFGNSFVQIDKRWQSFITASLGKALAIQFEEDPTLYTIFSIDGSIVYSTNIWKGTLPSIGDYSQNQNNLDLADFQTNYKSGSNKPVSPWSTPTNTTYAAASTTTMMIGGKDGSNNVLPFAAHYNGTQITEPHGFAVARGRYANEFNFAQPGYVATAATTLTAIRGTAYIEDTTGSQRSIVSSNANDTTNGAGGTGARLVQLRYFKNDGTGPFIENLLMSGTTNVNTVGTNIRFIESMEVLTVGSNTSNLGTISLKQNINGGGSTLASIAIGDNRTFFSHHYFGTNHKGGMVRLVLAASGNSYNVLPKYTFPLTANAAENQFQGTYRTIALQPSQQYHFDLEPVPFVQFTRITLWARADTSAAGTVFADMAFDEIDLS